MAETLVIEEHWELTLLIAKNTVLGVAFTVHARKLTSGTSLINTCLVVTNVAAWQAVTGADKSEGEVRGTDLAIILVQICASFARNVAVDAPVGGVIVASLAIGTL